MENNGDLVFRPIVQKNVLVYMLIVLCCVVFFTWGHFVLTGISVGILVILIIFMFIQPKTSYLKIKESEVIIGGLDIPTFKIVEQCIQCNNIESVALLKHPTNSVHIKVKNKDKKIAIDGFSDESFDKIKEILVGKGLPVSVTWMANNKRETKEFNKKS